MGVRVSKNGQIPKERTGLVLANVLPPGGLATRKVVDFGTFFCTSMLAKISPGAGICGHLLRLSEKSCVVSIPLFRDSVFKNWPNSGRWGRASISESADPWRFSEKSCVGFDTALSRFSFQKMAKSRKSEPDYYWRKLGPRWPRGPRNA